MIDPRSGKLLAYVSTDEETLPIAKAYPAASIVKILTASAVLETIGVDDSATCVYRGNKYRLNRRRLDPPKDGREASLETALASSNNQCFARWALHSVGEPRLRETFERFGWLSRPAPGHEAGRLEELETERIPLECHATPLAYLGAEGRISGMRFRRTETGDEFEVPADTILLATGQFPDFSWAGDVAEIDSEDLNSKLFAAGDYTQGASSLIIWNTCL